LFNAIVGENGTRMLRASKDLTYVMKRPLVVWDTIELLVPGTQYTVWSRNNETPFPNISDEIDLDDLCPESSVTNQYWKNLYVGNELRRKNRIYIE